MAWSKKELRKRLRELRAMRKPHYVVGDPKDFQCGEIVLGEPKPCLLTQVNLTEGS